jgi:GNAT superfamily N-acetyltransferase
MTADALRTTFDSNFELLLHTTAYLHTALLLPESTASSVQNIQHCNNYGRPFPTQHILRNRRRSASAHPPAPTNPRLTRTNPDIPEILAMIRELAAYEHAEHKVEATEETLKSTLTFAPSHTTSAEHTNPGYAKTFILRLPASDGENAGKVAGMAMFFNNYSTWRSRPGVYLEDLYVREQYRKRGYGRLLIQALAQETVRIGGGRLEWSCLKWNEPSLKFYASLGAKQMTDWVQLRLDGEALESVAAGKGAHVNGTK